MSEPSKSRLGPALALLAALVIELVVLMVPIQPSAPSAEPTEALADEQQPIARGALATSRGNSNAKHSVRLPDPASEPTGSVLRAVDRGCEYDAAALSPCTLASYLRRTVVDADPSLSEAIFQQGGRPLTLTVQAGADRIESARLCAVLDDAVIMKNGDLFERCDTSLAPTHEGVWQIGSDQYSVTGAEVERAVDDLDLTVGALAVTPFGAPGAGLMVTAVAGDSLFMRMGIQEGDVLLKVDERPITDLASIVETLDQRNPFTLEVERRGEPLELAYRIR